MFGLGIQELAKERALREPAGELLRTLQMFLRTWREISFEFLAQNTGQNISQSVAK